jgi:adenine/guanine/hypoxanthine permease
MIPNLASWGAGQIDNALSAAGTNAQKVGEDALNGAGLVYHGLHVLGQGATLAGIVLGAITVFILEKKALTAAIFAGVGAVLSWVGLLHADQVGWAAAPGVALGYAFLALVLVAIGLIQRNQGVVPVLEPESLDVPIPDGELPAIPAQATGSDPGDARTADAGTAEGARATV